MTELPVRTQVKRDAIHRAATTLFLRLGFEGTSMDAIAAEACVSKQTLYRYYQNKEALFIAVLEQLAVPQLADNTLLALQDAPIESLAALEHAVTVWAQTAMKNLMNPIYLGLLRLLIAELPRFPHLSVLFAQAVPGQGGAFLQGLLKNAHSHGVPLVDDCELVPRLLAGSLLTYVLGDGLLASGDSLHAPEPERVAALMRLVLTGIVRGNQKDVLS